MQKICDIHIILYVFFMKNKLRRRLEKNSLFLYLKWCIVQQDFSQLLINESVRATSATVKIRIIVIYLKRFFNLIKYVFYEFI